MNYTIERKINSVSDRVEKLPVWARDHIRDLERHARQCEQELKRILDNETVTPVSFTSHTLDIGDRKYIPADAVRFRIGPRIEIEVRLQDDHLHLMQTEGVVGRLYVSPCVTNVIDIYPE